MKRKLYFNDEKEATSLFVDDEKMFEECLFFDTLHRKTIFHYIIEKQQILNALIEKMSELN